LLYWATRKLAGLVPIHWRSFLLGAAAFLIVSVALSAVLIAVAASRRSRSRVPPHPFRRRSDSWLVPREVRREGRRASEDWLAKGDFRLN